MFNSEIIDWPAWILLSLSGIIICSYLRYTLNGPLIRFAEGYSFEWTPLGEWRKRRLHSS